MNYQEQKQLIQENVVPHLFGKIFITDHAVCVSQTDTMKLFHTLKQELPSGNYFLYRELNLEYIEQVNDNYSTKNYLFNFSLMPYARRHGLVKQLKKMISE